jgi:hypothetical protein
VRLELRRGVVRHADGEHLEVELDDGERAPAWHDPSTVGPCHLGDEVVVNVQARRLGLGSGGFDVVHCNLTRGLRGAKTGDAHVMKLNYTSLQYAVSPVEEGVEERLPVSSPAAVLSLHGQLEPLAWAFAQAAPGERLGYVQTAGGALPGAFSRVVRRLREDGLLAGHITAGPSYGGEREAITTIGALHHALRRWDAVVAGPGPGILGSGSALGHGGMIALDTAHAALALGVPTLVVARMSEADPRPRHRGISHHTTTVLDLMLKPVVVALPAGRSRLDDHHDWRVVDVDLSKYPHPLTTMGREDPLFFAAAIAAGTELAAMIPRR